MHANIRVLRWTRAAARLVYISSRVVETHFACCIYTTYILFILKMDLSVCSAVGTSWKPFLIKHKGMSQLFGSFQVHASLLAAVFGTVQKIEDVTGSQRQAEKYPVAGLGPRLRIGHNHFHMLTRQRR
jgi:hypothetical protein